MFSHSVHILLFVTSWTGEHQASLSFTISQSLLKLMSTESVMPSNHLILCPAPLLLPSIFPSIRVFSNESALRIRWPKYRRFSFSISSFNEYSGLISFRTDWCDLLIVQGTLKSLLQHHNLKASVLQCSAFFVVQLSRSYKTTRKTIALIIWTFVSKVMSLLFNMLSRFVIAFFPKEQESFNFVAAFVIYSDFGAQENKICNISTVTPSICHKVMGLDALILVFVHLAMDICYFHLTYIVNNIAVKMFLEIYILDPACIYSEFIPRSRIV